MDDKTQKEDLDESRTTRRGPVEAPRASLTERVSYAWGRWIALPTNPDDEFVLA